MLQWKIVEEGPEGAEISLCAACKEPIYAGETIRRDGRHLLHNEKACLVDWLRTNWLVSELCDGVGLHEEIAG